MTLFICMCPKMNYTQEVILIIGLWKTFLTTDGFLVNVGDNFFYIKGGLLAYPKTIQSAGLKNGKMHQLIFIGLAISVRS